MDHEVENDIHIKRAGSEYAEPVDLKKHRLSDDRGGRANRRIESFQMTDLADTAEASGQTNQFCSVRQRRRQRLFHQDVDASFHQCTGHLEMVNRRHSHRGSLDFAVHGDELLDGAESAATKFSGNRVRSRWVGIHDSHQPDGFPLLRVLMIDPGVVASESAPANYGYVNEVVSCQIPAPSETAADLITDGFMSHGTSSEGQSGRHGRARAARCR
jgi:hypothetical protein